MWEVLLPGLPGIRNELLRILVTSDEGCENRIPQTGDRDVPRKTAHIATTGNIHLWQRLTIVNVVLEKSGKN